MNRLKLAFGLLGLVALTIVIGLARDRFTQKARADAAKECNAASATAEKPLSSCLPAVKTEIGKARQAQACEEALLPQLRPETRFAMQQACGAGVKRLVADLDAEAGLRRQAESQLAEQRADNLKAVERAEARAGKQQEREDHARQIIADAPRGAGGGIACDADCLRRLGH